MGEQHWNHDLERAKTGALVVPLDDLRTIDFQTKVFISGEFPGSSFYSIASGKVGYLKQIIVTNFSGIYPAYLRWGDASVALSGNPSGSIAHLIISSGQAMGGSYLVEFKPALGPYQSGIVNVSGGSQIGGVITAIIQVDPKVPE